MLNNAKVEGSGTLWCPNRTVATVLSAVGVPEASLSKPCPSMYNHELGVKFGNRNGSEVAPGARVIEFGKPMELKGVKPGTVPGAAFKGISDELTKKDRPVYVT
jgi:hypothetical protein